MKKFIIFFIENLSGGGAENSVITVAAELARRGCRVHIAILDNCVEYHVPTIIKVHKLFAEVSYSLLPRATRLARVRAYLADAEAEHGEIDLIVSNLIRCDEILARVAHRNIYFCIRNHTSIREMQGKLFLRKFSVFKKIRSIYDGKNLITVSRGLEQDMVKNIGVRPTSIRMIYNGFDLVEIRKRAADSFEKPHAEYIIHVGSFKRQKRHDRLLRSYAASGIQSPLVLLGKGSTSRERKIRALCHSLGLEERVRFAGFHANVFPWIANAKMLVLSSDCEGFSRVVIEALACGTPVASVDCPSGPAEVLTGDLRRGLAELSVGGLANAMREIYHHPPSIPDNFLDKWSVESIATQYLCL